MLATAAVGAIIGEPGNVKALVKEGFARAAFARQAPAATTLGAPSLDLNNLVPELAPDSIEPDRAGLLQSCLTEDSPVLGYKWRPLSGIWATAPYLHNGSVASLYELLLPPSQRKKDFYVGSREFVPEHVGYNIDPSAENSFHFRVYDDAKTPIQGNFNGGHDYGNAGFSEEDRLDLVEYMKGL